MVIIIITTVINCANSYTINEKLKIRDKHVEMIMESKERQNKLTWKYLNMWMENGYISGHNAHEFNKLKRENGEQR